MISKEIRERLRGFLVYADLQLMRGNVDAAREAIEDARALVRACSDSTDEDDLEW
jgi:hypothetical protein